MKLRTRFAVVLTFVALLLGAGVGVQANASPAPASEGTSTNGCVVVVPLELAACLARF